MRTATIVLAPLVLLSLASCGGDQAVGTSADDLTIEVVVDVMSGVPNPAWTVSGSEAATLADAISALPERGRGGGDAALHLGFRGFVLRGLDLPGEADQVRVRGTEVIVSRGDEQGTVRTDEAREIYTMLRAMSTDHVDQNVMQAIPENGLKGFSS